MKQKINLRWLVRHRVHVTRDPRDDELFEQTYVDRPILQFFDGKKWKDIPAEHVTERP